MIDRKLLNRLVAHRVAIAPNNYSGDGFDLFTQGVSDYMSQNKLNDEDRRELAIIMALVDKKTKGE